MNLEEAQKIQIRKQFEEMKSLKDLVVLINFTNALLYGEKAFLIKLKTLTYFVNPKFSKKRYTDFTIKKKSGKDRIINAPVPQLKYILRTLNVIINCIYKPLSSVTGFVPNKSIVDNAQLHIDKNYVYNIDLKDFFHSFDRKWVKYGFMSKPFNLHDRKEIAFALASLCTHPLEINGETKIVLPQGSPTSPTITNILCVKLDRQLYHLAREYGATYSRYADDITFSANISFANTEDFQEKLSEIITKAGVEIKPSKTRLQKRGYRQEVTGLVVNDKVNVKRSYVKNIRACLHNWETKGYEEANTRFIAAYNGDKGHIKKGTPVMENVIGGKLEYLKMVKGYSNSTYIRLKERYDVLMEDIDPINLILNAIEAGDVDKANELYDQYFEEKSSGIRIEDVLGTNFTTLENDTDEEE